MSLSISPLVGDDTETTVETVRRDASPNNRLSTVQYSLQARQRTVFDTRQRARSHWRQGGLRDFSFNLTCIAAGQLDNDKAKQSSQQETVGRKPSTVPGKLITTAKTKNCFVKPLSLIQGLERFPRRLVVITLNRSEIAIVWSFRERGNQHFFLNFDDRSVL
jgi:hypothetical protein